MTNPQRLSGALVGALVGALAAACAEFMCLPRLVSAVVIFAVMENRRPWRNCKTR